MRFLKSFVSAALFLGVMLAPMQLMAATDILAGTCVQNPDAAACQDRDQTTSSNSIYGRDGILTKATNLVAFLVGIASVIMIVVGGFKYITSAGDNNNITSAKNTILYAVIGLVVALVARTIVIFITNKL